MRYTTVIDVTEIADVWKNPNISRLYFYMALKCGYHDDDRDILRISLRNLAAQASLTLSATRHALKVLETAKLVTQEKDAWRVVKFILDKKPTSRTQKNTMSSPETENMQRQQAEDQEKKERETRSYFESVAVETLEGMLSELREGKRIFIKELRRNVAPTLYNIEFFEKWLNYKKRHT